MSSSLLYFKHLFKTIKKKPLQPILLIVIFCIAFVLINTCIHATAAIGSENDNKKQEMYGTADLMVSVNSTSPTRFLFESDITKIDSDAKTCGILSMPYVLDKELVYGVATSFTSVNDIFDIRFIKYEKFKTSESEDVCFISKNFAEANNLNLNDKLKLEIYGGEVEYIIKGIAKNDFFARYDVMVDIKGARKILLNDNVLNYVLPSNVEPYNSIYIKTSDKANSLKLLSEALSEYEVKYATGEAALISDYVLAPFTFIIVGMTVVSSLAVLLSCIYQLSKERYEYSLLFRNCGFTKNRLLLFQILESIMYVTIASIVGFFISIFFVDFNLKSIDYQYSDVTFNALYSFISFIFVVVLSVITPLIFNLLPRYKKKTSRNTSIVFVIVSLIGFVVTFILEFFVMTTARFIVAMACVVFVILLIVLCVGPLYRRLAAYLADKAKNVRWKYALKNVCKVKSLSIICNLILLLSFCLTMTGLSMFASKGAINAFYEYFNAPFAVSGGSNRTYEKLASNEDFEIYEFTTNRIYFEEVGRNISVSCVSNMDMFGSAAAIDVLPKGNEIYLSYAMAVEYNVVKGKTYTISYNGKTKEVCVAGYYNGNYNDILADASYLELPYDTYLVSSKSNVSNDVLYQEITSALKDDPAVVALAESIETRLINNNKICLNFVKIFNFLLIGFSLIGLVDNIIGIYRDRKDEFELFRISGMTASDVKGMLGAEALYTAVFVIVCGIVLFVLAAFILHNALLAYSADYFYALKYYFIK